MNRITRFFMRRRIRKAKRKIAQRIHSNRDAYRLGFRRVEAARHE